ncbi:MAG: hypothetical protein LQ350_000825 [Teloschistes chrysophthalmus]|nr:MAG: hypothetical protein LQ350_000825 [Niorma chrysophthalma]
MSNTTTQGDREQWTAHTTNVTITRTPYPTLQRLQNAFQVFVSVSRSTAIVTKSLRTLWLFTKDDFDTFVFPNTIYGISTAFSNNLLIHDAPGSSIGALIKRLPLVIFFNWSNLLIFDLANQRMPDSLEEDLINKPWRPLPARRIMQRQTRQLLLVAMPIVLALNSMLGVWKETALLFNLTWIYNDLRGGDDNWLTRNLIIAFAFFLYNLGSLKVASKTTDGVEPAMDTTTYGWTALISAIIFTTMQIQDLKDQEGDRARARHTAPIDLGDSAARWTIAVSVLVWSMVCALIWHSFVLPIMIGLFVAYRVLGKR